MSPSWIWSDKITNSRYALVGYNHFISNKGEWNTCFSKCSNRVLPPIFISTILQSGKFLNFAHYFPYDVKLWLLAHSRRFLANQTARNAIVGAENLLKVIIHKLLFITSVSAAWRIKGSLTRVFSHHERKRVVWPSREWGETSMPCPCLVPIPL